MSEWLFRRLIIDFEPLVPLSYVRKVCTRMFEAYRMGDLSDEVYLSESGTMGPTCVNCCHDCGDE